MTASLPVLGEKHVEAISFLARKWPHHSNLREIEAHVRALVAGEVVIVRREEIEEVNRAIMFYGLTEARDKARHILTRWLTPQTQETKP